MFMDCIISCSYLCDYHQLTQPNQDHIQLSLFQVQFVPPADSVPEETPCKNIVCCDVSINILYIYQYYW